MTASTSSMPRPDLRWMAPVRYRVSTAIIGICGFVVVVVYGLVVARSSAATTWGQQILLDINDRHSPALDIVMRGLSIAFSPAFASLIVLGLLVILALIGRRIGDALFVGVSIGVLYGCTYVVKLIVGRPRPAPLPYMVSGLKPPTDPSYPSGHVAIVASMVVILFLVARQVWQRRAIAIVGTVLVLATAFARLYVGAHYLDDVLASMLYVPTVGSLIYMGLRWIDTRWDIVNRIDHWTRRN